MAYVRKKGDTSKPKASNAVLFVPKGSSAKPSITKLPIKGNEAQKVIKARKSGTVANKTTLPYKKGTAKKKLY